jgi:hypothetical protein
MRRSFPRVAAALAAVAVVLAFPALAAPKPKPDIAFRNKAAEVTVIIDPALKTAPALAANLLAEGRRWAEQRRSDADAARRDEGNSFPRDGYSYERRYQVASTVADRYVSILRNDYEYTGGAHPNSDVDTILWDRQAGKRISIRPFFRETANGGPAMKAMVAGVIAALKAEKARRGLDEQPEMNWFKGIEPSLLKIGPVVLAPSTQAGRSAGLTFNYAPYAVGAYAEGFYRAFVPWQQLKPYLSAEGEAIFGGERAKSDVDKDDD